MSDEKLARAVFRYFLDDPTDGSFRSLTTIFEQFLGPSGQRAEVFDHVDRNDDDKEALRSVLDEMVVDGLLEARMAERDYERSYRVTDQGIYQGSFEEPPFVVEQRPEQRQSSINSSAWTGIARVRIDNRNAHAMARLIDVALNELPRNDNLTVAQARTLLLAAKDLTDAPEPPSEIIWELIQRAGAVVGLLDIFVRVFVGLTH